MNSYLSEKIRNLSFIAILLIVILHGYNLPSNFDENSLTYKIENIIHNGFTRIAVPLFFIISGYLLFINNNKFSLVIYLDKIKKRFKSLVIPFLFNSGIYAFFLLGLYLLGYSFGEIKFDSIKDFFYVLIIKPIPFQLWFIRDLFIIILFSPIIYFFIKRLNYLCLAIFFVIWLYNYQCFKIIDNETVFFFSLGSFLAINKFNFVLKRNKNKLMLYTLFGFWFIFLTLRFVDVFFISELFLYRIAQLIGIVFIWLLYDAYSLSSFKSVRINKFVLHNRSYAFFCFIFHEPLLSSIKKTIPLDNLYLLTFFLYPVITIIICLKVGKFLIVRNNKLYKLLTGYR
jgi:hypothetical protein